MSNKFHGNLGKGLLNSKKLSLLDISGNGFSGALPLWIGRMSNLIHLNMSGNQLKGPFPHHLQNLSWLQVIDISHNSFSGSIPRNLDFPSLRELRLQSNEFMGSVPGTLFEAEYLEVLDLRNNKFSRMILSINDESSSLLVLLVGDNSFQSHIPEKICQLRQVGLLDLSRNKFKGVIPSCLGNMSFGRHRSYQLSFEMTEIIVLPSCQYASHLNDLEGTDFVQPAHLGYFNVSFNNLSCEIPLNGHLLTFGEMSYIGNAHLCGLPINKSCNPLPEPSASRQVKEEEEEGDGVIDMVWFYWTCCAVYISTSFALFAFLCIDSRWSRIWFYQVDLLVHHLQ